jgi:hypothetical protein
MDNINKIGQINSVNDLFDFKLSIKTLVILFIIWFIVALCVIILMFGGVNNTIDYFNKMIDETKSKLITNKNIKKIKSEPSKSSATIAEE